MTNQPKSVARRSRSILRLTLQVLAVLFVAIVGWVGWVFYTAKVQHDAVDAVEKAGGSVAYDWELKDGPLVPTPKPWWLKWLVDHLGADCFSNVIRVNLGVRGTDAELALVGKLGLVERLDARGSLITDAGVAHLKGLSQLEELNLGDTAITDAGLVHLRGLTKLRTLELYMTQVTDAGLRALDRLINLKTLGLWKSKVTDAGIQEIRKALPQLHYAG